MNLTRVQTKYLLLIYELHLKGYVRSCDLAKIMDVTTPCVHRLLEQLIEKNMVTKKKYAKVSLTEAGNIAALEYYPAYSTFRNFFEKSLNSDRNDAIKASLALVSELEPAVIRSMCENIAERQLTSDAAAG